MIILRMLLAFALSLIMLAGCSQAEPSQPAHTLKSAPEIISAPDAHMAVQAGSAIVVDVRTPSEWRRTGIADNAVGISLQDKALVSKVLDAANGSHIAHIIVMCRTGRRSATAADILRENGFTNVSNLRESFAGNATDGPGWKARGLPIEPYQK